MIHTSKSYSYIFIDLHFFASNWWSWTLSSNGWAWRGSPGFKAPFYVDGLPVSWMPQNQLSLERNGFLTRKGVKNLNQSLIHFDSRSFILISSLRLSRVSFKIHCFLKTKFENLDDIRLPDFVCLLALLRARQHTHREEMGNQSIRS